MTAIVSIDPTSTASFKRGWVRFPASAIGAALAMLFESLFGNTAFTYGVTASVTLYLCYQLKLYDGLVVAVLTAVAMVPQTHGHYLDAFLIRLCTTFTGITVSILINHFVVPPDYAKLIQRKKQTLFWQAGDLIRTSLSFSKKPSSLQKSWKSMDKEWRAAMTYIQFQDSEWHYHRHRLEKLDLIKSNRQQLKDFQPLIYHLFTLLQSERPYLTGSEEKWLTECGELAADFFQNESASWCDAASTTRKQLVMWFRQLSQQNTDTLSPKMKLIYELIAVYDIMKTMSRSRCQAR
ncbi:aromatic acid exporter family protein [Terrilactibacillus sp. S3-3]|nr:aromatic acid exporter family protein [Terrilactibacillus sp. S3-3]